MTDYDPVDLAMLACGWTQGAAKYNSGHLMTIARAMDLVDVAKMLDRLYAEAGGEWPGVWAYEVAEPLGIWIGRAFGRDDDMPSLVEIEAAARDIVAKAMAPARIIRQAN